MKINMYGGALTISYSMAKFLRRKGQDVTLFMDKELSDKSYAPEWEDEELKSGYPEWIKITDAKFAGALCGDKKARAFQHMLEDCDVLHLHAEACLWANLISKAFLYQSHGYDLDQLPFKRGSIKQLIISLFMRSSIRKASRVVAIPAERVFLKRLGVEDRQIYLPFPMDMDKYSRTADGLLRAGILSDHGAELIFFHPTRHEWKDNPTTNNKGNDKVLRAFACYTKKSPDKAVLILINKGRDLAESKKLIDDLGIRDQVIWLDAMPKNRLIDYYNASDIVLDQFNLGGFGQVFMESMACGRPTFIYMKDYEPIYEEQPPCINVFTEDEIANKLIDLSKDRPGREEIGNRSRQWIQKYHAWQNACDKFIDVYAELMREETKC